MTAALSTARAVQVLGPEHMDGPDWLAARRKGIGASDVAAVVGVSPYAGPFKVWMDKTGQLPNVDNEAMEWGRRLEGPVLHKFADSHPDWQVTFKPGMFADGHCPWRLVTPDGIAKTTDGCVLVEAKTSLSPFLDEEEWGEPGTDEVPLHYLCQVNWGCGLFGYSEWVMPVLQAGPVYREYSGRFDPQLFERLAVRVDRMWHQHIVPGVEPPADGLASTVDLLVGRHRAQRHAKGELPAEAATWARAYKTNHRTIAEFQAAKDQYGNLLRQALLAVNAEDGEVDGQVVATWRRTKDKPVEVFDLAAFREAHPGLYAEFTTTEIKRGEPRLDVKDI